MGRNCHLCGNGSCGVTDEAVRQPESWTIAGWDYKYALYNYNRKGKMMIEVHPGIFVGNEDDYSKIAHDEQWAIVHACKNPFHVDIVGYKRSLPNTHPEYRVARRGARLALNIVDAPNPALFSRELLIIPALDFMDEQRNEGKLILIHCNRGESRSPSLALLYLAKRLKVISSTSFIDAERAFIELYPSYSPKAGIRGHIEQNWNLY